MRRLFTLIGYVFFSLFIFSEERVLKSSGDCLAPMTLREVFFYSPVQKEQIGILPIGALNMAFAFFLRSDQYIESINQYYREGNTVRIKHEGEDVRIQLTKDNYTKDIIHLLKKGCMPEVILFTPKNTRLYESFSQIIQMVKELHQAKLLKTPSDVENYIPLFIILSNGIIYRECQTLLRDNLKSLFAAEVYEALNERFLRGLSVQTGNRFGKNLDAYYAVNKKGSIELVGGSSRNRKRVIDLFQKRDYPVTDFGNQTEKVEVKKGIINLATNAILLGYFLFDEYGDLKPERELILENLYTVYELNQISRELINALVRISIKGGVFQLKRDALSEEDLQWEIYDNCFQVWTQHNSHIPSTVSIVLEQLNSGTLPSFPALEENLIDYFIQQCETLELRNEERLLKGLKDAISQSIQDLKNYSQGKPLRYNQMQNFRFVSA